MVNIGNYTSSVLMDLSNVYVPIPTNTTTTSSTTSTSTTDTTPTLVIVEPNIGNFLLLPLLSFFIKRK